MKRVYISVFFSLALTFLPAYTFANDGPLYECTGAEFAVEFGSKIYANKSLNDATEGPHELEIPKGTYRVRLVSRDDDHPEQEDQALESWLVVFTDKDGNDVAFSPSTTDLPTDLERLEETISEDFILPADIVSLRAVHSAYPSEEPGSVIPVCAALDSVATPPDEEPEENRPPVLEEIPPVTITAGEIVSVSLNATDPDGDLLTFSATGTPALSVFDPDTASFSWQTRASDAGDHEVVFSVSDGEASDSKSFLITVLPVAPLCELPGLFGRYYNLPSDHPDVEGPITGVIPGTSPFDKDWFSDAYLAFERNDDLAALNHSSGFFPVDEGLAGDPFYFAVHWTGSVAATSSGSYPFKVSSDDDLWLFINGVEVINLGGIHSLSSTSTFVALGAGTSSIDIYFAERHMIQSGIEFVVPEELSFSPCDPAEPGPGNRLPVFAGPENASTTLGTLLEFSIVASDPDGDSLVISAILPAGAGYATSTGLFSWLPTSTSTIGTTTASFFAFDGTATSTHSVSIEVTEPSSDDENGDDNNGGGGGGPTNNLPVFSGPDVASTTIGTLLEFAVNATDPDGDVLKITALLPLGAEYATSTGLFSWLPTSTSTIGTTTASFFAFDGTATSTHAVLLEVNPEILPPEEESDDAGDNSGGGSSSGGGGGGGGGIILAANGPVQPLSFPGIPGGTNETSTGALPEVINAPTNNSAPSQPNIASVIPIGGTGGGSIEPDASIFEGISISTSTNVEARSADGAGRRLAALLFVGLLNFLDWLNASCCFLSLLLLLLIVSGFIAYLYYEKKNEKKGFVQDTGTESDPDLSVIAEDGFTDAEKEYWETYPQE